MQKLFGNNAGNEYLPHSIKFSNEDEAIKKRIGISVVHNNSDGSLIIKLVNLLPVASSIKLDFANLTIGAKADKSVLQGRPGDKNPPVIVTAVVVEQVVGRNLAALFIYGIENS